MGRELPLFQLTLVTGAPAPAKQWARPVLLERLAIFNAPSPEHYCSPPALVPFHTALCGSTKTWCWNAGSSPVSLLDPSAPKLDRASPAAEVVFFLTPVAAGG